jgi:hypothetical protein
MKCGIRAGSPGSLHFLTPKDQNRSELGKNRAETLFGYIAGRSNSFQVPYWMFRKF